MSKYIIGFMAVLALWGCEKATYMPFHTTDNIYFNFATSTDRDSVIYTFAYTPGKLKDTLWLPVRISGNRTGSDRSYKVMVSDSATTAVADKHYAALADHYTMKANAGIDSIPLILLNTDSNLSKRSVRLNLTLAATPDLGVAIADIIKARVIISNKLEKPKWWDLWLLNYSDVKFELFIIATNGVTELASGDDYGLYAPQSLYYRDLMNVLIGDPFGWVAANPGRGYVLEKRADGDYDFYNTATPSHRLLVRKDAGTGNYFFIDENGKQVV